MGETLLLTLGPKALAIVALAECAARTFGRRAAGLRAAIRTAGLGALLLIPVLSALLPHSGVRLPVPAFASQWLAPASKVEPRAPMALADPVRIASVAADKEPAPSRQQVHALPLAPTGLVLWLVGAFLLAARLLVDLWRVRCLERRASAIQIPSLDRLRQRLGVGDEIRTLETAALVVPVLTGFRAATILMPADARRWRADEVEMALLHELAHVRRRDYAVHLLSEIVRAVYWPNPFVWYAVDRAAADREQACDDEVLGAGGVPSAYAEQLVGLARRLSPPTGALALVRVSSLKQRIRALLQTDLDRRPVRRSARRVVSASAVAAAAIAGCLDVAAGAAPAAIVPCDGRPPVDVALPSPRLPDGRVQALLDSSEARVREAAAWAVARLDGGETNATLASLMLNGPTTHDRLMAATVVRELAETSFVPALMTALDDRAFCVRWTATRSLRDLHDPRALGRLSRVYRHDPNADVRVMAAKALGAIGAPASVAVLIEGLGDSDADVREKTVQSLSRLGRPEAIPALRASLSDSSEVVRRAAGRAIDRIAARHPSSL